MCSSLEPPSTRLWTCIVSTGSRMEPYICIASADPAAHDPPLDYHSRQPAESLFQPLHHQVFPQHHFAQQRHEGESRCPARRLPIHRRHRHGLPLRMGE